MSTWYPLAARMHIDGLALSSRDASSSMPIPAMLPSSTPRSKPEGLASASVQALSVESAVVTVYP